jgi:hypothetical protein
MACQFSSDFITTDPAFFFSIDGSNLCVKFSLGSYSNQVRSFPLTDSDLSIADSIVDELKSNMSSDEVLAAKRGFSIMESIAKGLSVV